MNYTNANLHVLALALLMLLGACAVQVEHDPGFRVAPQDTYAWLEGPRFFGKDENSDIHTEKLRRALERELAARGLGQATADRADFLLDANVSVQSKQLGRDDWEVGLYQGRIVEEAVLIVELRHRETGKLAWQGTMEAKLRESARTMGGATARMTPTEEPRAWRIEHMVGRVLEKLPVE